MSLNSSHVVCNCELFLIDSLPLSIFLAPNVTNLQVNETQSTSTSAYLFWTLEPNGILVDEYEVIIIMHILCVHVFVQQFIQ